VAFGIAVGMRCLHSVGILHRDLKSDNIMLNEDLHPQIGDFSLAKMMNNGAERDINRIEMTMNIGTPLYMAPERYSDEERHVVGAYGFAVDVYAYGMILYELVTGIPIWETLAGEFPSPFQLRKFVNEGQRPQIPSWVSDNYRELITSCWAQDPSQRPTFDQIVNRALNGPLLQFPDTDENEYSEYQGAMMAALS
jgi:serine/threonine protein kinase